MDIRKSHASIIAKILHAYLFFVLLTPACIGNSVTLFAPNESDKRHESNVYFDEDLVTHKLEKRWGTRGNATSPPNSTKPQNDDVQTPQHAVFPEPTWFNGIFSKNIDPPVVQKMKKTFKGFSLAKDSDNGQQLSEFVRKALQFIECNGELGTKGLFRVSSNKSNKLLEEYIKYVSYRDSRLASRRAKAKSFAFEDYKVTAGDVSNALKSFIRYQQEPFFPNKLLNRILAIVVRQNTTATPTNDIRIMIQDVFDKETKDEIKKAIAEILIGNKKYKIRLMRHLGSTLQKVAECKETNEPYSNLAVYFSQVLFRVDTHINEVEAITKGILEQWDTLFPSYRNDIVPTCRINENNECNRGAKTGMGTFRRPDRDRLDLNKFLQGVPAEPLAETDPSKNVKDTISGHDGASRLQPPYSTTGQTQRHPATPQPNRFGPATGNRGAMEPQGRSRETGLSEELSKQSQQTRNLPSILREPGRPPNGQRVTFGRLPVVTNQAPLERTSYLRRTVNTLESKTGTPLLPDFEFDSFSESLGIPTQQEQSKQANRDVNRPIPIASEMSRLYENYKQELESEMKKQNWTETMFKHKLHFREKLLRDVYDKEISRMNSGTTNNYPTLDDMRKAWDQAIMVAHRETLEKCMNEKFIEKYKNWLQSRNETAYILTRKVEERKKLLQRELRLTWYQRTNKGLNKNWPTIDDMIPIWREASIKADKEEAHNLQGGFMPSSNTHQVLQRKLEIRRKPNLTDKCGLNDSTDATAGADTKHLFEFHNPLLKSTETETGSEIKKKSSESSEDIFHSFEPEEGKASDEAKERLRVLGQKFEPSNRIQEWRKEVQTETTLEDEMREFKSTLDPTLPREIRNKKIEQYRRYVMNMEKNVLQRANTKDATPEQITSHRRIQYSNLKYLRNQDYGPDSVINRGRTIKPAQNEPPNISRTFYADRNNMNYDYHL
ncbi:rhoGAP domain-containing protein [Ditylenchus destructor]|nr:rhoGAP domain-containing protein [Ditylenchus destructor]